MFFYNAYATEPDRVQYLVMSRRCIEYEIRCTDSQGRESFGERWDIIKKGLDDTFMCYRVME